LIRISDLVHFDQNKKPNFPDHTKMKKNLNNIMLGLSLVFIFSISIYFIVEKMKAENIGHYMDILGQKLMALLPEEKEKGEIAQMYDQFKQQVKDRKVAPEKVEKIAAEILNLENLTDSLRLLKAEESMVLALGGIPEFDPIAPPDIPVENSPYLPRPGDEEKWLKLSARLKEVYVFDENLKRIQERKESHQRRIYVYDDSLHVIIDSQMRQDLLQDATEDLLESIKELEQQNRLTWEGDQEMKLKQKMDILQDSLRMLKYKITEVNALPEMIVRTPSPDSVKVSIMFSTDSVYQRASSKKRIR
jgi:hypothetical protein